MLLIHSIFLEKLELCLSGGQVEIFHYWEKKRRKLFSFFKERRGKTTQVSVQVQHNKLYHKISARQIPCSQLKEQ